MELGKAVASGALMGVGMLTVVSYGGHHFEASQQLHEQALKAGELPTATIDEKLDEYKDEQFKAMVGALGGAAMMFYGLSKYELAIRRKPKPADIPENLIPASE